MSALPDAGLRERDAAARRAAQTVFDRPLVLEAGAGTGKTTTLVARILAWVLGPGWDEAAAALAEAAAARGETSPPEPERVAARALEGVVAITFTEAAAAEMAHRTAAELAAVAAGTPPRWLQPGPPSTIEPADPASRAAALVATLDHLQVSTIHAFCLGLLAAHPVEAGLHPQLQVDAEGRTVEAVVRETVEAALREAYGDPGDPAFLALAAQGKGPPEIVAALVELIAAGVPASALAADPLAGPEAAAVVARLADAARAVHALVAPRLGDPIRHLDNARAIRDALAGLVADLDRGPEGEPAADAPDLAALAARLRDAFPESHRDRLGEWAKKGGKGKTEAAAFADVAVSLMAAAGELAPIVEHLCRLEPDLLTAARRVLEPLLAAVERELVGRGVLTFQDLLARAAGLLRRRADVRARERRRIRQLLVDEFQDTDRLQCELVGWLALDGPADARPGLFLVGDPKQSIYGWRSADLASYDAFLDRVRAAGGEVHPLVLNFRSPPPILDEVERAIAPVMEKERGLQPPFEALLAREDRLDDLGFVAGGRAAVEYWVSWPEQAAGGGGDPAEDDDEDGGPAAGPIEDGTRLEAVALARDVVDLHRRHEVPWGEIAVLLRSTTDLDLYLEALRERGVPFAVARDKQYYRRREVIEAAALVRAVLDPGDHVALMTVLRSSMVGVPDAALIPLWRRHLPRRLTDLGGGDDPDGRRDGAALAEIAAEVAAAATELPSGVPGLDRLAGWPAALIAAAEHLACARRAFRREPADRFVDTLRRLFLIEPVEAARYLGSYRLANLERFFTKLGTVLEAGGGDAAAVLRALRRSVAEALDAQEARPEEGADDAVQVMTIHTAKGLDFGHVYLVQLHKQTGGDREPQVEAAPVGDPGEGIAGWEYRLFGAPTPGFDRVEAQRRRIEAAERVRTLYVAMTRAKERLVLLGRWDADPPLRSVEAARHHLDLLAHRDGRLELGELWADAHRQPGAAGRDRHGALWRFPARFLSAEEPAAATAGNDEGPALPTAEAVERAAAELAARRAEATLRAARPVSRAASEDAHRLLRALAAESEEGADEEGRSGGGRREAAMAAGAAVHRALELFDLAADPDEEAARQRAALAGYLGESEMNDRETEGSALDRARQTLDRFVRGPLLPRLRSLSGHVLARELPVLLPTPEDAAAASESGPTVHDDELPAPPVGFVAGTIDLLYRDPESGAFVVADYKTDRVETEADLAERVRAYAAQGAVYLRALRDGFHPSAFGGKAGQPPEIRFEIWALHAGRVVPVPDPAEPPPPPGPLSPPPAPPPGGRGPGQLDLFPD